MFEETKPTFLKTKKSIFIKKLVFVFGMGYCFKLTENIFKYSKVSMSISDIQ